MRDYLKHRFRFSLRALLLLMLLLGCLLLPLINRMNEARRQKAAVAAIKQLQGIVFYDYEMEVDGGTTAGLLRKLLGDDFFCRVETVRFFRYGRPNQISNADLRHLQELSGLVTLDLGGAEITDEGLQHLTGLKSLETLDLRFSKVTPSGVAKLRKALPNCWIDHESTSGVKR